MTTAMERMPSDVVRAGDAHGTFSNSQSQGAPHDVQAAVRAEWSEDDEEDDPAFPWVSEFCAAPGNEFFCEVDTYYIQDRFNLTGLAQEVPGAVGAHERIMRDEPESRPRGRGAKSGAPGDDERGEADARTEAAARHMYGLIHARYILSPYGMARMKRKYEAGVFGSCPRILCGGQALLPVGMSDRAGEGKLKVFCPRCVDMYNPRSRAHAAIDGAYFGTTFPHMFMLQYAHLRPAPAEEPAGGAHAYVPRIFGFRLASPAHRAVFDSALRH